MLWQAGHCGPLNRSQALLKAASKSNSRTCVSERKCLAVQIQMRNTLSLMFAQNPRSTQENNEKWPPLENMLIHRELPFKSTFWTIADVPMSLLCHHEYLTARFREPCSCSRIPYWLSTCSASPTCSSTTNTQRALMTADEFNVLSHFLSMMSSWWKAVSDLCVSWSRHTPWSGTTRYSLLSKQKILSGLLVLGKSRKINVHFLNSVDPHKWLHRISDISPARKTRLQFLSVWVAFAVFDHRVRGPKNLKPIRENVSNFFLRLTGLLLDFWGMLVSTANEINTSRMAVEVQSPLSWRICLIPQMQI